jgi:nickel-dependent lactate racemase
MEFFHEGSAGTVISETRADELIDSLLDQLRQRGPWRRVLILPPDITRLHSWAGFLTCRLYEKLRDTATIAILPAIGTHAPMTDAELARMFPGIPKDLFHAHDWRQGIVALGEVPAALIREVSEGKLDFPVRVEVDRLAWIPTVPQ